MFLDPKVALKFGNKKQKSIPILDKLWDNVWTYFGQFGGRFGPQTGPEGAKMGPRGPSRAPENEKNKFKKVVSAWDCLHFGRSKRDTSSQAFTKLAFDSFLKPKMLSVGGSMAWATAWAKASHGLIRLLRAL